MLFKVSDSANFNRNTQQNGRPPRDSVSVRSVALRRPVAGPSSEWELRNRYREVAGRACLLPLDLIIQPLIVLRRASGRVGAARRRLVRHDGRPRAAEDTWSLVRRGSGGRIAIRAGWLTAASAIGELIVEPLGVRGDGGATRASETHAASVVGLAASQLPAEPFVVCDRGGVLSTQQHLHTSGKRRTRLLPTPVLCC